MRYYDLTISSISSGKVVRRWTSHPDGLNSVPDPGALNVEFDVIVSPYAIAAGDATGGGDYAGPFIRVWGIPLADIAQAANLSAPTGAPGPTYKAVLRGGMGKGLPLANPAEAGIIVQGYVWRAIGNWLGTSMTLDIYLTALPVSLAETNANVPNLPINNFTFFCQAGQSLAAAINVALMAAYPSVPVNVSISPSLIANYPLIGVYATLQEFADYLNKQTVSLIGASNPGYQGAQVYLRNGALTVTDGRGSSASNSTGGTTAPRFKNATISFTDLIGQPTWVGNNTIQVTTVLRGDLQLGDSIVLPPGLTTIAAGAVNTPPATNAPARFSSQFQGSFQLINPLRHVGNYKAPQATQWVSVFTAAQTPGQILATKTTSAQLPSTPAPLASVS